MLNASPEEKQDVVRYFLSQSPDAEVRFAQKVYAESVMGHTHAVWDVHASDGRWWIITNPKNLYSQEQFPNMDLVVTFHLGLCLRIPRNDIKAADVAGVRPYVDLLGSLSDCGDALSQSNDPGSFRAIGVRCRENLLSFVHITQDTFEWPDDDLPQRSAFLLWVDLIFDTFLSGADNRERRRLIKSNLKEAWAFVNWLTHSQSARWLDAEAATLTVGHAVGMATDICVRRFRGAPDVCPECQSHHLSPQEGMRSDIPDVVFERPVCGDCGWQGEPVPVGERDPEEIGQMITRAGDNDYGPGIMTKPLTHIWRPDD